MSLAFVPSQTKCFLPYSIATAAANPTKPIAPAFTTAVSIAPALEVPVLDPGAAAPDAPLPLADDPPLLAASLLTEAVGAIWLLTMLELA